MNPSDKARIYSNVSNLQDITNEVGKPYRIEDQLPAGTKAMKSKQRHAMWRNKKRSTAESLEMSIKKGKLYVQNTEFRSKIVKPNVHVLLKLKQDEIVELNKVGDKVKAGAVVEKSSSKFQGFVADVSTIDEVNKTYEWVRYQNLSSRHTICAFRLPGPMFPEMQDFYDDEEHEAGKKLLDYMIETEQESRVIFVTRNYDGTHIGPQRFDCIIDAAKSAVNQKPYNEVANEFQFSWTDQRKQHKNSRRSYRRGGFAGQPLMHIDNAPLQTEMEESELDEEVEFRTGAPNWGDQVLPTSTSMINHTDHCSYTQFQPPNSLSSATLPK